MRLRLDPQKLEVIGLVEQSHLPAPANAADARDQAARTFSTSRSV